MFEKRESHLEMQICSAKFSQKHFHGLEEFVIFCEIQKGELEKQKQNELFRGKIKVPRKKTTWDRDTDGVTRKRTET